MDIAVLGATGKTGRHVVSIAVERGHRVRALARKPPDAQQQGVTYLPANIESVSEMMRLVDGCEAVISALGPSKDRMDVCSTATGTLLAAGIKRLIIVSGAGIDVPGDKKDVVGRIVSLMVRLLSPGAFRDKQLEYAKLAASTADWTLARAPRLVDGPPRGTLKVSLERALSSQLTRQALAGFCVDEAETPRYIRQAPFVSE
jgi:putative NADH-flavin reductase